MQRGDPMAIPNVNLPKPVTVQTAKVKPPNANLPAKPSEPTWKDKLASYQTNPEAAKTEIERAQNKANLQESTGDTEGYKASTHWIGQINTATGQNSNPQVQQFNEYQAKQKELMNRFEGMINQPTTYNPEADPRYQAYKTLYEKQAKKASSNAMETMNDRGILNSTITGDRLGQIEQEAQSNALAAVPDFYAQDQQAQQDRLRNTAQLLGFATDEARYTKDNQYRDQEFDYRQERDSVGDDQYQQELEYRSARDAIGDERYKAEFDEDVRRYGQDFALNKAIQQGQLDVSRMNAQTSRQSANTSAGNLQLSRDRFNYDKEQADQPDNAGYSQDQINSYDSLLSAYQNNYDDPTEAYNFLTSPQGRKNALDYGLNEGLYNQMVNTLEGSIKNNQPETQKTADDYFGMLDKSPNLDQGMVVNPEGLKGEILRLPISEAEMERLYDRYNLRPSE
jgi:hypothetical protein